MITLPQQFDSRVTSFKAKEYSKLYCTFFVQFFQISNTEISWSPKSSELFEGAVNVPAELDAFLYSLLIGNTEMP